MAGRPGASYGSWSAWRRLPRAAKARILCACAGLVLLLPGCSTGISKEAIPLILSAPAASGPVEMDCILAREGLIPSPTEWGGTAYRVLDSPWQYEVIELVVPFGCEVLGTDGSRTVVDSSPSAEVRGESVAGRATVTGTFANGGSRVIATRIVLGDGALPDVDGPPVLPPRTEAAAQELRATGDASVFIDDFPETDARWLSITIPSTGNSSGMSAQVVQFAVIDGNTEIRGALGHPKSIDEVLASGLGTSGVWATAELEVRGEGVHVRSLVIGG